jgi:protease-4
MPMAPAPKPRKSWGWMILALVLLLMLGVSVLFNIGQLFSGLSTIPTTRHQLGGPRLQEVLIENNDAAAKIAVVPIEGIITGDPIDGTGFSMVDVVSAQLNRAENDHRVKAVVLRVDSPGGEVLASDEIAAAIREFQEDSGKPVIVSMGNLAASGGYYVSAPGRWIVANELTITGSIGVIMSGLNYRGLMDKVGLEPQVYKSGRFKDMLSGARKPGEIPEEERKMVQALIDEVYARFTNVVAEGRADAHDENGTDGKALIKDWNEYADGRVFSGSDALKYGFVDELGNFDVAVERALEIAEIEEADVVEYRRLVEFGDIFRMFGETESRAIKVDLGIEAPKLKTGLPYFLYLH